MDENAVEPEVQPLVELAIPRRDDDEPPYVLRAVPGRTTVFVGPNGSGKSALSVALHRMSAGSVPTVRLIAHRRLWLDSSGPEMTSRTRESLTEQIRSYDVELSSRWLDHVNTQRTSAVLYDLMAMVNERNARGMALVDAGAQTEDVREVVEPSLLDHVNVILERAHLGLKLKLENDATFQAVPLTPGSDEYPIAHMSDGEKSALFLAANVLVAPPNALVIVDEPERHLHRSISAGLIEAVLVERKDCHFIVLTHDLELAASLPRSTTDLVVLASCEWDSGNTTGWELHEVEADGELPDSARRAILGGRRQILLVEGNAVGSLDLPLYRLLFPLWNVTPAGGCDEVIRAVTGLRKSEAHHWTHARGIVDGDGRTEDERGVLARKGILALPVHEIESLYYTDAVLLAMSTQQGKALGRGAPELHDGAVKQALAALQAADTRERLAKAAAHSVARRRLVSQFPDPDTLATSGTDITVTVSSPYQEALNDLNDLFAQKDLEGIVTRYPIRETQMRGNVSKALHFANVSDYQDAVRARVRSDDSFAQVLRSLVGELPTPA